jgi:membrane protein
MSSSGAASAAAVKKTLRKIVENLMPNEAINGRREKRTGERRDGDTSRPYLLRPRILGGLVVIPGIKGLTLREFTGRLYKEFVDDAVTDSSAQVSYYFLFSLFPLLFCLVAVAAFFPIEGLLEQMLERVRPLVPADALGLVETHLRGLLEQRPRLLTFGALTALWSASRGVDAFRKALNLAYDVNESRPFWRTQLLAIAVTLAGLMLSVMAFALFILGSKVGFWLANKLQLGTALLVVWSWLRWPIAGGILMLVVALSYYLLPDVKQKFKYITPGSVLGTGAWLGTTWAFTQYVEQFGKFNVTYGSIGGVMVLLLWLYLSALVFIMGGEINAILEHASAEGKAKGARSEGEAPLPPAERPSAAPPGIAKSEQAARRVRLRFWRRRSAPPER